MHLISCFFSLHGHCLALVNSLVISCVDPVCGAWPVPLWLPWSGDAIFHLHQSRDDLFWNSAYRPDEGPRPPHFFNILCMAFVRVAASAGYGIWDVACSSPARLLCGHALRAYRIKQPCWVCCSLSHFWFILLAELHCFFDQEKKIFALWQSP